MVHGGGCPLRPVDAFGAGFSCTSYSNLNKDAIKNATAMARAEEDDPDVPWKKLVLTSNELLLIYYLSIINNQH